jgi:hypothetical protein
MRRMFALLLLCCSTVYAEENPAVACIEQLVTEPSFAPIANKLPLGDMSDISFEKLAIKAKPTKKESKLIAEWAEVHSSCFNQGLKYAKTNYPPQVVALAIEANNREIAVVASLFNKEISYGEANKQIQAIADDFRNKVTAVVEQIKSEQATKQLAQDQAKKSQDTQEAAQQESDRRFAAQQQAQADAQRRQLAAQMLLNSMRTPLIAPIVPYQMPVRPSVNTNCYQNGNQISCTSQ